MRKLLIGAVAAATVFVAPQAMAQVGFGPGGAGVEFGTPYASPYYDYYGPRHYAPGRSYYRDHSDSYYRWRKERYPYMETDR